MTEQTITEIDRIDITIEDINQGAQENASSCPIALAFKRKGYNMAFIYASHAYLYPANYQEPTGILHNNHPDIQAWLANYDNDQPVKPFTLIVNHDSEQNTPTLEMAQEDPALESS